MKLLHYLLTALTGLAAVISVAYFMYQHGTGLFTVLPDLMTGFLVGNPSLQYVAVTVVIVCLAANLAVIHALRRQKTDNRV